MNISNKSEQHETQINEKYGKIELLRVVNPFI